MNVTVLVFAAILLVAMAALRHGLKRLSGERSSQDEPGGTMDALSPWPGPHGAVPPLPSFPWSPPHFRQGDILLVAAGAVARGARPAASGVLAEGEATGHAHRVDLEHAQVFVAADGELYVENDEPAEIRHEEHGTITLPAGIWRVVRQREYHPREVRRVLD